MCAGIVVLIWRDRPDYVGNDTPASGHVRDRFPLWGAMRLIRESAYLKSIAALILIAALTTTIAGWQFKAIAKQAVPATDELAMFFGTFNMIAGLMSLVLQLVLTSRVLRTVGVGPALFIVPTAMLMGSTGVWLLGTLVAAAALEGERSGAALFDRQGHGRAAVSAGARRAHVPGQVVHRYRRLSVRRCRRRPGGAAFAAGARLVAGADVDRSCIVFVAMWIAAAYVARRQYVENLRESIHQHRVDAERASMPVMDRDTTSLITARLKGTPKEIAYALSLFELAHDRKIHPAVRGLLQTRRPGDPPAGDPAARARPATPPSRTRSSSSSRIRISASAPRRCCI